MAASRKRKKVEEEHENVERWLLTYADMITLLMVLFIVLFSIGQTDLKKFEDLRSGLASTFGVAEPALEGQGILDGGAAPTGEGLNEEAEAALLALQQRESELREEQGALREAREDIQNALAGQGLGDTVAYRLTPRGLVLQIVTDRILFDLGRADLKPEGIQVLDGIADAVGTLPNEISVEGHTDDRPLNGGLPYPTNWELSTGRANAVLRYFVEQKGFPANKISAAGYADQRPLFPNDSDENQARNRRVEIVVLTQADPAQGSEG